MQIKTKRIYESVSTRDGARILVDRLWPRGASKYAAKLNAWWKDIAPSDPLRKWYRHDAAKWPEFRNRYLAELKQKQGTIQTLLEEAGEHKTLTLLYSARDEHQNQAAVLKEFLSEMLRA
ncbi:MAG: DUF488 family protein [Leptospiraceae bacterium]|nr:DUF488 family protein [Leptospiraceae bacterium]